MKNHRVSYGNEHKKYMNHEERQNRICKITKMNFHCNNFEFSHENMRDYIE